MPVEIIKFAETLVDKENHCTGSRGDSSGSSIGEAFLTDEGNHILDCNFGQIPDPPALARQLEKYAGGGGTWVVYRNGCDRFDRQG